MSLTLRLKETSTIPIVVENVLPEVVAGLSIDQLSHLQIQHGNRQVELGSLFNLHFDQQADSETHPLIWEGDLKSVHWIGAGMTQGEIVVDGSAGRHLGSQMSGGCIIVNGDAGDFTGCEMTGGSIRIRGNAADWVGAAYPGSKIGVNRGQIVVDGNAGRGAAMAMRRGTICIGGNTGPLAGWNMRAGTLIIGGDTGEMLGKGMLRGTLFLTQPDNLATAVRNLPPTFTAGGNLQSAAMMMLARWADEQCFSAQINPDALLHLFHGDQLRGGRGEVLIAQNT